MKYTKLDICDPESLFNKKKERKNTLYSCLIINVKGVAFSDEQRETYHPNLQLPFAYGAL